MRGDRMHQHKKRTINCKNLHLEECQRIVGRRLYSFGKCLNWHRLELPSRLALLILITSSIVAQDQSKAKVDAVSAAPAPMPAVRLQTPGSQTKRLITISDAVSIFLQQNLQLVAARYDIDETDAEKLSAKVRPNPEVTIGASGLP